MWLVSDWGCHHHLGFGAGMWLDHFWFSHYLVGKKDFMKRLLLTALLSILMTGAAFAESFKISDIRVTGLQRVSAGSVFGALPLNVGDEVDDQSLVDATRTLFKTGFFQDV